ncbi:hypothetical protein GNY06_04875 [Elizabethkingia argentiflava]|uniref:Uncharacterized protein n=1 Tax=Elizabethkingia argenteiflava TaxID=2681556 RepID=A0A845PRB4_9FLAO|nr:hypothetical protein [Elizabethkingia argenteiflava]NAW50742.1 hypothetical protein [Elizabethkingia argenteiflava]
MISFHDLQKSLELCINSQKINKNNLNIWFQRIEESHLSEREEYKKKLELSLIASLFQHFPEIEIENLICESPDFIIKYKNKKIGLEVSEIINHFELKKKETQISKIFRNVEKRLEEGFGNYSGIYYMSLQENDVDFNKNPQIVEQEIISYIIKRKKTKYIQKMRKTPYDKGVFLVLDFNISLFDELKSEKIAEIIYKKNKKFRIYKKEVDECWLVLVSNMNNLASRYSYIDYNKPLSSIKSPFSRIMHIENLYSQLLYIK